MYGQSDEVVNKLSSFPTREILAESYVADTVSHDVSVHCVVTKDLLNVTAS